MQFPASLPLSTLRFPLKHADSGLFPRVRLLRLDLVHPLISGNKFFKLFYALQEAREQGFGQLLTFGGAFSNHLVATAAAAREFGMRSVGIIRGEELRDKRPRNPTLYWAERCGMVLHFVPRTAYRQKEGQDFKAALKRAFGTVYFIPEGGTGPLAVKGMAEVQRYIPADVQDIFTAAGTGGTAAGLILGGQPQQHVHVLPVLKGDFMEGAIRQLLAPFPMQGAPWSLWPDPAHEGGYGRFSAPLLQFIRDFYQVNGIVLDPVYTVKVLFSLERFLRGDLPPMGSCW
ncbi:1-aminocyclopropane-1-carboxylate deaminase [Nitritalea halalkaliphila LW7]|uniref:1-aminocyclopropane-1-carboxylate deaminase n=1 Tax=Nitritalea halalkaliphila LW7 TaxID=1189621 RepID=I5C7Q9_9BACT|nr:pyridoxal-phosphate dependent enzyme [Nitritalea halalkaliphila]EIM77861.1 1-aminocyclopropane-1-carboxylate deaminase [Nitritalea halalkaliphila LW7]